MTGGTCDETAQDYHSREGRLAELLRPRVAEQGKPGTPIY